MTKLFPFPALTTPLPSIAETNVMVVNGVKKFSAKETATFINRALVL